MPVAGYLVDQVLAAVEVAPAVSELTGAMEM
jgi:hypothetical protein